MGALEDMDQQHPDDHSSVGSFSLVSDENQSIVEYQSNITSLESEESVIDLTNQSTVALGKPSSSNPIYEIAKLSYRDFVIGILTDDEREPRRFFFEPIVLLDPTTVSVQSDQVLNQNLVRFKIKLWTQELRSKVYDRLRSTYSDIQLDDISVIPYEELKLVAKPDGTIPQSVRLVEEKISYKRLSESIPFYFICDSLDSATILADFLRENPEFLLERCQLALECNGLALSSRANSIEKSPSDRPIRATFNVSTLPIKMQSKIRGTIKRLIGSFSPVFGVNPLSALLMIYLLLIGCFLSSFLFSYLNTNQDTQVKNSTNVVPVFSVTTFNYAATNNQFIPFSTFDFDTKTEHGDFNLRNGTFTVKTAGIYQFHYSGHVHLGRDKIWQQTVHHFEIRVNDKARALAYASMSGYYWGIILPVDLSAFMQLNSGDEVGVFRVKGSLLDFGIRFSCILFSI